MIGNANIAVGWVSIFAGATSGGLIGLWFDRESFLGGYSAFSRRMVRLGHIAFVGLGILNILFALTLRALDIRGPYALTSSIGFIVGAVTMPISCFLMAWKHRGKFLFVVPVSGVGIGVVALLLGWWLG